MADRFELLELDREPRAKAPDTYDGAERFELLELDLAPRAVCDLVAELAALPGYAPIQPRDPREAYELCRRGELTLAGAFECVDLWKAQGDWYPAHGGTETPFYTQAGRRLLYCYQPRSGRHAYLDLGTDTIVSDSEVHLYL